MNSLAFALMVGVAGVGPLLASTALAQDDARAGTVAAASQDGEPDEMDAVARPVGTQELCRKYIPALGTMVQVPCGPAAKAATTTAIDEERGVCRKYLPMIGTMAEVPCTAAPDTEALDVGAPEQECDRLTGEKIVFDKTANDRGAAETACRTAVALYPETRRFKFQLARALHARGAYNEALDLYRPLAEAGYARAMNNLGALYERGLGVRRDYVEAANWYRKASEQGFAPAQNRLGKMYFNGRGVSKDEAEAVRWFRKGAEQGFAGAQTSLGFAYAHGRGVPRDDAEAVTWYRKAADRDFAPAQFNLGVMYADGQGLPKSDTQAVKWFRKAADQGFAVAQNDLGLMYVEGRGVPADKIEAHKWLSLAATGYANSTVARDRLAKSMTAAQITEAQRLARAWKPNAPSVD